MWTSYYDDKERAGIYFTLAEGNANAGYKYVKVSDKAVHDTSISKVWIAEREMPDRPQTRELCVIKETNRIIERETLTKFSGVSVKLKDYLPQISLVDHENLVRFYGYGKTHSDGCKYRLVLICEYCPGESTLPATCSSKILFSTVASIWIYVCSM